MILKFSLFGCALLCSTYQNRCTFSLVYDPKGDVSFLESVWWCVLRNASQISRMENRSADGMDWGLNRPLVPLVEGHDLRCPIHFFFEILKAILLWNGDEILKEGLLWFVEVFEKKKFLKSCLLISESDWALKSNLRRRQRIKIDIWSCWFCWISKGNILKDLNKIPLNLFNIQKSFLFKFFI